jgi:hypothetical protein
VQNVKTEIRKTMILYFFFLLCHTRSILLKFQQNPRAFSKRVLGQIFGPKKEELAGDWRQLQNEELRYTYTSLITDRVINPLKRRVKAHLPSAGIIRS